MRLGVPFIFFTIVAMVIKVLFSEDMARTSELSFIEFVRAIFFPYDGPMREFWFIFVIFWMFALRPVWVFILQKKLRQLCCGIILVILSLTVGKMGGLEFMCIGRAVVFAIFFYAGLLFREHRGESYITKPIIWLIISLTAFVVLFIYDMDIPLLMPFVGIIASITMAMVLDKQVPQIFRGFRNYTYQIYLMGIFFQIAIKMVYRRSNIIDVNDVGYLAFYIVCILLGIYMPVIISKLFLKINSAPLLMLIGLKKH